MTEGIVTEGIVTMGIVTPGGPCRVFHVWWPGQQETGGKYIENIHNGNSALFQRRRKGKGRNPALENPPNRGAPGGRRVPPGQASNPAILGNPF